jgi:hypothetical protein
MVKANRFQNAIFGSQEDRNFLGNFNKPHDGEFGNINQDPGTCFPEIFSSNGKGLNIRFSLFKGKEETRPMLVARWFPCDNQKTTGRCGRVGRKGHRTGFPLSSSMGLA